MKVERVQANLDFQTVYQALGLLLENVDNAKKAEYEATLSLDNKGLPVFNTTDSKVYVWTGAAFIQLGAGGGGGAVDSVNGQTGVVVLDADDISDAATTNKYTTTGDISKLAGIEALAEVNNISDVNATDLTDGGDTTLHTHDSRYYTEGETDTLLSGKANSSHTHVKADITDFAHTHVISDTTGLQTALDNKVDENTAITGATKTKITYDAKGLITSGADATSDDIGEGITNLYWSNVRTIASVLTGISVTGSNIISTDTILEALGKLQNQINSVLGGVSYQASWNANTNTPTITSSVGTKGHYYVVDIPGATLIDGISDWKLGDWIIFNGTVWQKIDNTDAVISVNGYAGTVTLTTADIADTTNKRYVTDADLVVLGNTSGTNTGDQTLPVISDTAYDATSWNTNTDGATKNAIRDKIETMDSAIVLNTAKVTNATHTGDVTGAAALTIANDAVTYAKMQNVSATDRILGRDAVGAGDVEELTVSGGLEFTGTGIQRSALTGDITATAGSNTTTLANTAVTPASYTNTNLTVDSKGRIIAASSGLTWAQVTQATYNALAPPDSNTLYIIVG